MFGQQLSASNEIDPILAIQDEPRPALIVEDFRRIREYLQDRTGASATVAMADAGYDGLAVGTHPHLPTSA